MGNKVYIRRDPSTIQINPQGAFMHYEDSGTPRSSSDYMTLVIIHGLIFHGAGFLSLFPKAAAHNLRIISLNLRDYPGSSPYTPSELNSLCSENVEDQVAAIRSLGCEIAAFLKYIVETENLLPMRDVAGKRSGGITVMSWSLGNLWTMSLFGNASTVDQETSSTLLPMLRAWIVYDPPHVAAGAPLPNEVYFPLVDESMTLLQRGHAFRRWVSSFYTPIPELTGDGQSLGKCSNIFDATGDETYRATTDILSAAEVEAITTPDVLLRSARFLFTLNNKVSLENVQRALCGVDGSFPHVQALLLWCDMSCGVCPVGSKAVADEVQKAHAEGRVTREVKVIKLERANHFLHWHEPDRFLRTIVENV